MACGALAVGLVAPAAQGGVTFTNLVSFDGTNGYSPRGTLVQGRDGHLYGVAGSTVFKMTLDGTLTLLASFNGTNGISPQAGLVQGTNGDFYGTTIIGGPSFREGDPNHQGYGTVFRVTPDGVLTSLVSFNGTNGARPVAALVQGADGNFYGSTHMGGQYDDQAIFDYGTLFRVTPGGVLTTLVSFNNSEPSGSDPWGALVQGSDGQLYGTTRQGGGSANASGWGAGTLFRMDLAGTIIVLSPLDGTNFTGSMFGLVQGLDGNFYGTGLGGTNYGPMGLPFGKVFRATPEGVLTTVASFNGTNGATPRGLMLARDGNFYGLTGLGGTNYDGSWDGSYGTIFQLTPDGKLTTLVSFDGTNGNNPFGGLVQASDGNLYGMTMWGGAYGDGLVFRLSVPMPPVLQSLSQTNGRVTLTWSAVAGQTYQVQYCTNLGQTNWINVGSPCLATSGTASASEAIGPDPQRLYRVVLLP